MFDRLRYRRQDARCFLFAFDLLELNGQDFRREPLEVRKRQLATLRGMPGSACSSMSTWSTRMARSSSATPARWASRGSSRSGSARPTPPADQSDWLKMKKPACEAVTREEEEEWSYRTWMY